MINSPQYVFSQEIVRNPKVPLGLLGSYWGISALPPGLVGVITLYIALLQKLLPCSRLDLYINNSDAAGRPICGREEMKCKQIHSACTWPLLSEHTSDTHCTNIRYIIFRIIVDENRKLKTSTGDCAWMYCGGLRNLLGQWWSRSENYRL